MTAEFSTLAGLLRRLNEALATLEPAAASIGVPPAVDDERRQSATHKLVPQVRGDCAVGRRRRRGNEHR